MSTLSFEQVSQAVWDLIIVGAGVAGASLAIRAARHGFKTLLIEAKAFPREKVCGGCLNQRAQASLASLGVLQPLHDKGAVRIQRLDLRINQVAVNWPIPDLLSVRRSTLDNFIVETSIAAGATFLSETKAMILPEEPDCSVQAGLRQVAIRRCELSGIVEAKLVIVADGLTRSSLRNLPHMESAARMDSRIGVQVILDSREFEFRPPSETLQMLVSNEGYVGLSLTDGGKVDVAAAIDPRAIEQPGRISGAVERIMSRCLRSNVRLGDQWSWLTTPRLSRTSSHVSANRLLSIGDSNGYVEPFTGEGMSWALSSAEAIFPFVVSTIESSWQRKNGEAWSNWVRIQRIRKQRECRWLAYALRRPWLAACGLGICDHLSPLRAMLIRKAVS
jgi:flavin-dependent dehydrogenase